MSTPESEARLALEAFPTTWRRIMTDPHGFFADMPETGGLGQPFGFLAICAAVNAAGHLLVGGGVRGLVVALVGQLIGAVLVAALFVLVAQHLFEGRGGFESTFRVVAYAAAPLVVLWVPVLGVLAWLYRAYLMLRGVERVQGLDTTRALLTVLVGLGALGVLGAVRPGGPLWF